MSVKTPKKSSYLIVETRKSLIGRAFEGLGGMIPFRRHAANPILEIMTLAFYATFIGFLGAALYGDQSGNILGIGFGLLLGFVAIMFRRWGVGWALSHTEKRERDAIDKKLDTKREIAPHNNFMILSDSFYISMEVFVLSFISSRLILISYSSFPEIFSEFYRQYSYYFNLFYSIYRGLDHEIGAHMGSAYEARVPVIISTSMVVLVSCLYGIVLVFFRQFLCWGRYWVHLSRVNHEIKLKNESKILASLLITLPTIIISIDAVFYGGLEFFLIMDSIPEDNWYISFSVGKYILAAGTGVLCLSFLTSWILTYFVLLLFYFLRSKDFQKQQH